MAQKERSKDLLAGLFLLTGVGLFFLSLLVLGRERNLFGLFTPFISYFSDVRGLNVGAPVRLSGISVGRVANIDLSSDFKESRVQVTLEVQDEFVNRIRTDSVASIETQGLLGDKFININNSSLGKPLARNGVIAAVESADLNSIVRKVETLADSTTTGMQAISDLSKAFDPAKLKETVDNLQNITRSLSNSTAASDLSEVIRELKTGNGLLHALIYSPHDGTQFSDSLKSFARATANLEQITESLSKGSGTLGALLIDSKVYDNLVEVTDDAKRSIVLRSVVRSALNDAELGDQASIGKQ